MAQLEVNASEILVSSARERREAMSKDEVTDVRRFNDMMSGLIG